MKRSWLEGSKADEVADEVRTAGPVGAVRLRAAHAVGIALATVFLAACSALPVPHSVDLRSQMVDDSGSIEADIRAGENPQLDLRVPSNTGECLDFSEVAPGAKIHSAQLHWIVDVSYDGPELTGKLQARAYAARSGDAVFDSQNTLGPVFTVDLGRTTTRLAGTAVLNPRQLEAVNDREVCWGVDITGEDVSALEDGSATIRYDIERLRLSITFSVI